MNTLKKKILNGEKTSGLLITSTDVAFSVIASRCGYDFVWLDLEHSYISLEEASHHVNALKKEGVPVIVRVPENEPLGRKRCLRWVWTELSSLW